jgi:ubiquinone/menaquinone biosynthesis C-methylase UbiE
MVQWIIMRGRERAFREKIVDMVRLQSGESVLDVGCGTGTLAITAKERVGKAGRVAGIDPSGQLIHGARRKAARRSLTIDFEIAGIEQLNYPDRSFDVVLSTFMMHHLQGDLKRQGLAEVARVLKPGGRLLIVDFKGPAGTIILDEKTDDHTGFMKGLGYSHIETGDVAFKVRSLGGKEAGHQEVGYVLAQTSPEPTRR